MPIPEFSTSTFAGPSPVSISPNAEDDSLDAGPPVPLPSESATITEYKGLPLVNVGRDPRTGKVIPHHRSDRVAKQISIWVAGGYDVNAIAFRLNVRPGLLKRHYAVELATGAERVGMDVTQHIVARVKKSDRMAIFYAKSRMGWRDGEQQNTEGSLLNIHIHA